MKLKFTYLEDERMVSIFDEDGNKRLTAITDKDFIYVEEMSDIVYQISTEDYDNEDENTNGDDT